MSAMMSIIKSIVATFSKEDSLTEILAHDVLKPLVLIYCTIRDKQCIVQIISSTRVILKTLNTEMKN